MKVFTPTDHLKAEAFLLDWLENAAIAGARCPTNEEMSTGLIAKALPVSARGGKTHLKALCAAGKILVEVGGQNWRVVTIMQGPYAGRRSMIDPKGGAIYLRMGKETKRVEA